MSNRVHPETLAHYGNIARNNARTETVPINVGALRDILALVEELIGAVTEDVAPDPIALVVDSTDDDDVDPDTYYWDRLYDVDKIDVAPWQSLGPTGAY